MLLRFLRWPNHTFALQQAKLNVSAAVRCPSASLAHKESSCYLAVSEEGTKALASALAQKRKPGDCICLRGEVGAGKSAFRCRLRPGDKIRCMLPDCAGQSNKDFRAAGHTSGLWKEMTLCLSPPRPSCCKMSTNT